jgi:hypothetical protein
MDLADGNHSISFRDITDSSSSVVDRIVDVDIDRDRSSAVIASIAFFSRII